MWVFLLMRLLRDGNFVPSCFFFCIRGQRDGFIIEYEYRFMLSYKKKNNQSHVSLEILRF